MSKETRMKLEKVFDALGEIIAFLAVVCLAVFLADKNFNFLPENISNILYNIKEWVGLVLIAVTGFECTIKRNFLIRIIFYLLVIAIIVMMFLPGYTDWIKETIMTLSK